MLMAVAFRKYLAGKIKKTTLFGEIAYRDMNHLHSLLREMYEINKIELHKLLIYWIREMAHIENNLGKLNKYIIELKKLNPNEQDTRDLIEIVVNFKVIQMLVDKCHNLEENFFNLSKDFDYKLTVGHVFKLLINGAGLSSINEIEGLNFLTKLTRLDLSRNSISRIEGLNSLVMLKELDLSFNEIYKIEGLNRLKNLEVLDLSNNQIRKIEGLEALQNLRELYLNQNDIQDSVILPSLFKKLTHLKFVFLAGKDYCRENVEEMFKFT